jgi:MOSC domain-containing protein YiiM
MLQIPTYLDSFPLCGSGRLQWIGVRPARGTAIQAVEEALIDPRYALVGDRYARGDGKRAITLVQAEHLPMIAQWLGLDVLDPALLRRNLVVSGVNLIALKGRQFRIGNALLLGTGPCDPCSKMEHTLGAGALQALRGHGGITASVLSGGRIALGDVLLPLARGSDQ